MDQREEIEITPARAWTEFWKWVPSGAVMAAILIVLGGLVLLVGWGVAGWFQNANTNRDARIQEHSFTYQQSAIEQARQDITNVFQSAGNKQAAAAWAGEACATAVKIDQIPADMVSWVGTNCTAGSLSPSSPYFIHGGNQ